MQKIRYIKIFLFVISARKSAVYTKRTSNENILGNSNNNNDKENNKPISHPPPSSTLKSKFQPEKEEMKNNSSSDNKNLSKQVIESSPIGKSVF